MQDFTSLPECCVSPEVGGTCLQGCPGAGEEGQGEPCPDNTGIASPMLPGACCTPTLPVIRIPSQQLPPYLKKIPGALTAFLQLCKHPCLHKWLFDFCSKKSVITATVRTMAETQRWWATYSDSACRLRGLSLMCVWRPGGLGFHHPRPPLHSLHNYVLTTHVCQAPSLMAGI